MKRFALPALLVVALVGSAASAAFACGKTMAASGGCSKPASGEALAACAHGKITLASLTGTPTHAAHDAATMPASEVSLTSSSDAVGGCAKAKAAKMAGGETGCAKAKAAKMAGGETGCAKAKAAKMAGGESGCAKAKAAKVADGDGCCAKAKAAKVAGGDGCCAKAKATKVADGEDHCAKAKAAKVAGGDGCCAKAKATKVADGEDHCAKAKAAKVAGGDGCCAKAKAAKVADGGDHCAKAKAAQVAEGTSGCAKAAAAATLASAEGALCHHPGVGTVKLEGTMTCGHCGLGLTESCVPVLRAQNGCTIPLAASAVVDSLHDEATPGVSLVRIKGKMGDDGLITVSSFRLVGSTQDAAGL